MITPLALVDSAAFTFGQQHERRRIGELLRTRRSILVALPGPRQRSAIAEPDRMIAAIDEAP